MSVREWLAIEEIKDHCKNTSAVVAVLVLLFIVRKASDHFADPAAWWIYGWHLIHESATYILLVALVLTSFWRSMHRLHRGGSDATTVAI